MPRSIRKPNINKWTLRKLIQNTYTNMYSRVEYAERDTLKRITIKKISVYNYETPSVPRTKYIIKSYSYPQYEPYFKTDKNGIGRDVRGRAIKYQRSYKHEYTVTIQMDELSLDCDAIKLRTGSEAQPVFTEEGKGQWEGKGRHRRYKEGQNIKKGINLDFFYRLEYLYKQEGILFGRNWATYPPNKTNPKHIIFLDKHMWNSIKYLVNKGVIQ